MLLSNIYSAMGNVVIQSNVIKITETTAFHYVSIRVLPAKLNSGYLRQMEFNAGNWLQRV